MSSRRGCLSVTESPPDNTGPPARVVVLDKVSGVRATADERGTYYVCGLPEEAQITIWAVSGSDTGSAVRASVRPGGLSLSGTFRALTDRISARPDMRTGVEGNQMGTLIQSGRRGRLTLAHTA